MPRGRRYSRHACFAAGWLSDITALLIAASSPPVNSGAGSSACWLSDTTRYCFLTELTYNTQLADDCGSGVDAIDDKCVITFGVCDHLVCKLFGRLAL